MRESGWPPVSCTCWPTKRWVVETSSGVVSPAGETVMVDELSPIDALAAARKRGEEARRSAVAGRALPGSRARSPAAMAGVNGGGGGVAAAAGALWMR